MDIQEAEKRCEKAFSNQSNWRDLLEDAYFYIVPERNNFTLKSQGEEEDNHVYDETAPVSAPKFANRMQRALFPADQEWVQFKAGEDIGEDEKERVNRELSLYTKRFFSFFNQTNFHTEINPALVDCSISTGVIQLEEEPLTSDKVCHWVNIPLNEIAFEKPVKGRLVNSWRKLKMECGKIQSKWPKAKIPQKLSEMITKDPNKEVELKMGHVKEDEKFNVYLYWEKEELFKETFNSQRIIPFRLNAFPGETFGRGPGILALPVIRDVNVIQQLIIENAAINVAGMYTAISDGIFNPYTFTVSAGGIIPVKSNNDQNPTLRRMENSGDLHMGQLIIEEKQDSIRKIFFVDPMGDLSDPVRSATEQTFRMQEFLKDQGAALFRMRTELVEPVVMAMADVLTSRGKLPNIKLDGKTLKIVHNTQLVQAEKQDDYQNLIQWLNGIIGTVGPEVMMGTVRIEDLPTGMAEMLGVDPKYIRDKAERAELVDRLRQAIGQNQAAVPAN